MPPQRIAASVLKIGLSVHLQRPWIVLLRICTPFSTLSAGNSTSKPTTRHPRSTPRPRRIRVIPVNHGEVAIFWKLPSNAFKRNRFVVFYMLCYICLFEYIWNIYAALRAPGAFNRLKCFSGRLVDIGATSTISQTTHRL